VPAAILLLACLLALASPAQAPEQDVWAGVERVVAVGDVHGDYDQFVTLLRSAELVDGKGNWRGGRAHLVQNGDVLDRGPRARPVLDLLIKLTDQARRAGGRVHALLGNHEAMNLYGDLRYVAPEEFAAFSDSDSEARRAAYYEQYVEELKKSPPAGGLPRFDDEYRKQWLTKTPLGFVERAYQFGPKGVYGKWLRSRNAVVKIDDTLFLHGGISAKYAGYSAREINERVRAELAAFPPPENGFTTDADGPLWYRGLMQDPEGALRDHVDKVLAFQGIRRLVVAHTVTDGTVMPRLGGKVVGIDVGLSALYGARLACLVLERERAYTLHRGHKIPLPDDSTRSLLDYLRQAAALDPQPSPLARRIAELEVALAQPRP
jgi:hypothetical protein